VDCGFVTRSIELIELANRLCQPQFVELIESTIIDQLNTSAAADQDVIESVLHLLEPAQVSTCLKLDLNIYAWFMFI